MDGKQEIMAEPSLTAPTPAPASPQVKTLKCSGCGSPITLRGMERTESVACEACGSVIDLTDENLRIFHLRPRSTQAAHPLGSGKIRDFRETLPAAGIVG
jgi:hypothetical protein